MRREPGFQGFRATRATVWRPALEGDPFSLVGLRALELLAQSKRGEGPAAGWVPNTTWWLVSDDVVVGVSNLRHALTEKLRLDGGRIGYCVRPSARGRGNAREILRCTLDRAREMGLSEVILTCAKTNVASVRTIFGGRGVFVSEDFLPKRGEIVQRYRISLEPMKPTT